MHVFCEKQSLAYVLCLIIMQIFDSSLARVWFIWGHSYYWKGVIRWDSKRIRLDEEAR